MFRRKLIESLEKLAGYPAIAIMGPRQSGKTTLAKLAFPHHTYVSLEDLSMRRLALEDPKGFLAMYKDAHGVILDEFQNVPELLSYLQLAIDQTYKPNYFILTGSQNFLMNQAISQTLAGRIGILTLLPLSIGEMADNNLLSATAEQAIFSGGYPRIYDQKIEPTVWYPDYINTYVERDIRDLKQVTDLSLFRKFVGLCAGRAGQLLNVTSLGNDVGVTGPTARAWLSLLEASYIIFLLQPHHGNFGKRLIKSPKLYFYDTGLACSLLGITSALQLSTHYLRGGLFESFIIADLIKQSYNRGERPRIYFWQDSQKHEVDCIIDRENKLIPVEIKAGHTVNPDFFSGLDYWNGLTGGKAGESWVVYAGDDDQSWPKGNLVSWRHVGNVIKE